MSAITLEEFQQTDDDAVVAHFTMTLRFTPPARRAFYIRKDDEVAFYVTDHEGLVAEYAFDGIPDEAEVYVFVRRGGRKIVFLIYHEF